MESAEMYKQLTLQVSSLAQTVSELQQEVLKLKGIVHPALEPAHPEPYVLLPDRFDGSRSSFTNFRMDCELLFVLKPRTYYSDFVKVHSAVNLLSGRMKTWAYQKLQEKSAILDNWESFISALGSQCLILQKATSKSAPGSRRLRLPREKVNPYEYNDSAGLRYKPAVHSRSCHPDSIPICLDIPEVKEEPMEIGAVRTRLSSKERDRRRNSGLCFYCGERGHFISFCPTRPSKPKVLSVDTIQTHPVFPESQPGNCQGCCQPCPRSVSEKGIQTMAVYECSTPVEVPPQALGTSVPLSKETPILVSTPTTSCLDDEVLPPDCTYASNGTMVRKQDLKIFEEALKAANSSPEKDLCEEPVHIRRMSLKGGYCHGSRHAIQTARRGRC